MSNNDDVSSVEISLQHSLSIAATDEQVVDLEQLPEEEYNNDDGTITLPEDGAVASSSSKDKKKYAVAALALVAVTAVVLGVGYGTSTSSNEKTTSAAQAGNFGTLGGTSSKSSKSSTKSSYSGSAKSSKSKSSKRGSNDECTDTPDWVDVDGDNCTWYETNDDPGCPERGYYPSDEGPAVDNCCYCKSSGDGCFPRTCTDVSDCCDSGLSDDECVLKTGYCWDYDPDDNDSGEDVEPDEELVSCSPANECTDNANCTGNSPVCLLGGPVDGLDIRSSWCSNSTRPINAGVCGRGES